MDQYKLLKYKAEAYVKMKIIAREEPPTGGNVDPASKFLVPQDLSEDVKKLEDLMIPSKVGSIYSYKYKEVTFFTPFLG